MCSIDNHHHHHLYYLHLKQEVRDMATLTGRVTNAYDATQRLRRLGYRITSGVDRDGMEYWIATVRGATGVALPGKSARTMDRAELIAWASCLS